MKEGIGWDCASVPKETCIWPSSQAGDKNCSCGRGFVLSGMAERHPQCSCCQGVA
jgi:hypothetical protein